MHRTGAQSLASAETTGLRWTAVRGSRSARRSVLPTRLWHRQSPPQTRLAGFVPSYGVGHPAGETPRALDPGKASLSARRPIGWHLWCYSMPTCAKRRRLADVTKLLQCWEEALLPPFGSALYGSHPTTECYCTRVTRTLHPAGGLACAFGGYSGSPVAAFVYRPTAGVPSST